MEEKKILVPPSITDNLPAMVRNELLNLSPQEQEEFIEEYRRKTKSTGVTYVLWLVFGAHYAYLRKWGIQVVFWLTLGGLIIWWIVDAFRIPGMIRDYNKDVAVDVLRLQKTISPQKQK